MILVDTSVWIEYLRRGHEQLSELLDSGTVIGHPFVVGEMACGQLRNRLEVLDLFERLPQAPLVPHEEAIRLLESERLYGQGLGWIDLHLLASALSSGCSLWSFDKVLSRSAGALGIETS